MFQRIFCRHFYFNIEPSSNGANNKRPFHTPLYRIKQPGYVPSQVRLAIKRKEFIILAF